MIWIDFARLVSIFAVVFLHVAAFSLADSKIGTESWWISNIYDSLVRWCVPVFVMISGALLLDPSKNESIRQFYSKRLSKILIPLIFWTAFYLIWGFHTKTIKGDLLLKTIQGKPFYHLWFLYMISLLYLVTPYLRKIYNSSVPKERYLFAAITLAFPALTALYAKVYGNELRFGLTFFLSYMGYFFFGQIIRQDQTPVRHARWFGVTLGATIATTLGCYFWGDYKSSKAGSYFYSYLSITVIPQSIAIFYLFKSVMISSRWTGVVRSLSSVSMGVYLIHPVVLHYLKVGGFTHAIAPVAISIPVLSLTVFTLSAVISAAILRIPILRKVI